jgi:hypothetical protein
MDKLTDAKILSKILLNTLQYHIKKINYVQLGYIKEM